MGFITRLQKKERNTCDDMGWNCCNCGGESCGCAYCWDCHACEACKEDNGQPCEMLQSAT